ncbi:MAG TPA: GNAT family N-acetyltransferase [Streptosporangiaceae bacterium]|jgi:GNAT superfamily N-acetyltransferase
MTRQAPQQDRLARRDEPSGRSASARVVIRPADRPGDLGWMVQAHGEIYSAEYGWDTSFEALVARIVAEYAADHDPVREAAWLAEVDGERAGCVLCVAADNTTAKLRILLTTPSARGRGAGTALVRTCVEFARQAGYLRMVLWTNDVLVGARRIYLASGFRLVAEEPHHSFGADLVGQTYEVELATGPSVPAR